jgi:hypothetical protein
MTLRLEIETTNAAFDGEAFGPELARILRELADDIETDQMGPGDEVNLYDVNGNRVGTAWLGEEGNDQ